jgi:glycosyltransferase involved in cell wall biosynthesis
MSLLASEWAALGHDITIVTFTPTGRDAYALHERVRRVGLGVEMESHSWLQAITHNLRKVVALRRVARTLAPDVVISFLDKTNVLAVLSCSGLGVPLIVSERTHPTYHSIGIVWSLLRRVTYGIADAIVVQSEVSRRWAKAIIRRPLVCVIPNPVGSQFSNDDPQVGREAIVLGVGRLGPEKGFDLLIEAFAHVAQKHAEWSLVLAGEGPLEESLKDLAARRLPDGAVRFAGLVKHPERLYRRAGLFVMSSRFEGFPNALLEAMACGCAVIATDCPGGTSEIVRHGINGLLVPPDNAEELAQMLEQLLDDPAERNRLAVGATQSTDRFRIAGILPLWEDCLSQVLGRRAESRNHERLSG